jgi:formate dehydrogenase iron-sulfur subunit
MYGDRSDMISLAQERLAELKRGAFPRAEIYGLKELDGLGMMYILPEGKSSAMAKYALPENPRVPLSTEVWNYIFKPVRIILVAALGFALWINRSESKKEQTEKSA